MKTNRITKICKKCGMEKPVEDFYFDNYNKRYKSYCKICCKNMAIEWRRKKRRKKVCSKIKNSIADTHCEDCYYKGLRRGADEKGHIYYCRKLHIKIRNYTPADSCCHFIDRDSAYEDNTAEWVN